MKRRMFLNALLAGTVGIASVSSITYADHPSFSGKHFSGNSVQFVAKRLNSLTKKLDLNPDQKQQMQIVMENQINAMKPLREQKKAIRESLRNLDPTANTYDEELAKLAYEKSELVRQITLARGQKRKSIAAILTAEQQAQIKQMREKRRGHRKYCKHH